MALDLSSIAFKVDTKELENAVSKLGELQKAVSDLNKPLAAVTASTEKLSKAQAKATKEQSDSNDATNKAVTAKQKLVAVEEEAATKLTAVERKLEQQATKMKVLRDETIELTDGVERLGKGFTSGQASQIATLKLLGATSEQVKILSKSFQEYNDITGINTFDASANGLSRLNKEIKELSQVNSLASKGLGLTREELKFLARDTNSLTQAFGAEGRSAEDLTSAIARLNTEFVEASKVRNQLVAEAKMHESAIVNEAKAQAEAARLQQNSSEAMFRNHLAKQDQIRTTHEQVMKEMRDFYKQEEKLSNVSVVSGNNPTAEAHVLQFYKKQAQEANNAAKATSYLEREMQRAENALQGLNADMQISSSNRLLKFKEGLAAAGVASDEAARRYAAYAKVIKDTDSKRQTQQKNTREEELKYLARATSVQLGDIGISLAGGQNPLLVFIQQGDQLRAVLNQVGGNAKEMQQAMSQAFSQIVVGFIDVAKALGTFVTGAFKDAAGYLVNYVGNITGLSSAYKNLHDRLTAVAAANDGFSSSISKFTLGTLERLGGFVIPAVATTVAGMAVAIGVAVAAFVKLDKEQTEIAKTSTLLGASMGLTSDNVYLLGNALGEANGSATKSIEVINTMAKAGGFASSQISLITETAIELEKKAGVSIEETVKQFKKLADEPSKALIEVAKSTGFVTAETIKMVMELEALGHKAEAAAAAQKAYADASKQAAETVKQNYGLLQTLAVTTGDFFSKMWDKILGLGRNNPNEILGNLKQRLEDLRAGTGIAYTLSPEGISKMIADTEAQIKALQKQSSVEQQIAVDREKNARAATVLADAEKLLSGNQSASLKYRVATNKLIALEQELSATGLLTAQKQLEIDNERNRLYAEYMKQFDKKEKSTTTKKDPIATAYAKAMAVFSKDANAATAAQEQYTKAQQDFLNVASSPEWNSYSTKQKQNIAAAAEEAISREKVVEQTKEQLKAQLALQKTWDASVKAQAAADKSNADLLDLLDEKSNLLDEEIYSLMAQKAIYGDLTTDQKKMIEYKKIDLAYAKEIQKIEKEAKDDSTKTEALRIAADNRDKARAKVRLADDLENIKTIQAKYEEVSSTIADSIEAALFEGGQAGTKKLRDYIVAKLRKPITIAIKAVVDTALGGTSGMLSNMAGSVGGGMIGSFLSGTAGFGSGLQAGFGALLNGGLTEAVTAGFTTAISGTGFASFGAGLGTIAGALGPIALGLSLLSSLDDSGTMHTGGAGGYSKATGASNISTNALGFNLSDADISQVTVKASQDIAKGIVGLLDSTASTFGKEAGYYAATAFADDTSKDGAWGALLVKLGDKVITDWSIGQEGKIPKEFADGEAGAAQYISEVTKEVRSLLLEQTPDWADTMLNALGDAPSIESLVNTVSQINQVVSAIEGMGRASAAFAGMAEQATSDLITSLGGAEAAVSSLNSYYADFYTEAERSAFVTAQLTAQLTDIGQAMPETREEFRAMVDTAVAIGDTDLASKLLKLSPVFASVTQSIEDDIKSLNEAAKTKAKEALDIVKVQYDIEKSILEKRITTLDKSTQSLTSLFDLLTSSIKELYSSTEATSQQQVYSAQSLISNAIASGGTGDLSGLPDAINTVKQSIDTTSYSSLFEEERSRLVLAGELTQLQEYVGDQIETNDKQLLELRDQSEQFDLMIEQYQAQIDLIGVVNTSVLSIADAIVVLQDILDPSGSKRNPQQSTNSNNIAYNTSDGSLDAYRTSIDDLPEYAKQDWQKVGNSYVNIGSQTMAGMDDYYAGRLTAAYWSPEADMASTFNQLIQSNFAGSPSALMTAAKSSGIDPNILESYAKEFGIASYDVGTNYVPYDQLALVHQGEAIVPRQFNQMTSTIDNIVNERMASALENMRYELQSIAVSTSKTARTLDRISPDGNSLAVTVV